MKSYVVACLVALFLSVLVTPLVRRFALRIGAVSTPGGRHVHGRTVPRLGGIALALAWAVPVIGLALRDPAVVTALHGRLIQVVAVVIGGAVICAVGAVDDARGMRSIYKLAAQALVACFAFGCGFQIQAVHLPLLGDLQMGVFALPVTVLWIVGVTNAVNLIDGLDGLAAGVSFFAAFTSFVIASLSGSVFVALTMAALMGALVGFLFFNFNPARIFMGDSGSYFLGFVLATTALAGGGLQQKASTAVSLLVPVLALGVPIFDTLFSMFRRLLERRSIFSADRGHVHHRLLDLGLTHRRAVLFLYGVSSLLAAGAIAVSLGRSWHVGLALLSVTLVFVGLVRFLGYFEYLHFRRRQKSRLRDPFTENLRRVVPRLIVGMSKVSTEAEALGFLERLTMQSDVVCVEVHHGGQQIHCWNKSGVDCAKRDLIGMTFPLGRSDSAVSSLKFRWSSDLEDPAPQVDVLLQILVDELARTLVAFESSLAPAVKHAERDLPSSPVAAVLS
ncbi:MAG TPA: MraY family glycosyltransferase [Polyangiaceae bacterium]|jgi:UDP-GlcNAc:undecaprenyl-phosphate GlcNAc-1-phosphate transferase|nr:MraY family glycosyltransferase [Polyangiaceae bacterium]